jgi:hypothetical protein
MAYSPFYVIFIHDFKVTWAFILVTLAQHPKRSCPTITTVQLSPKIIPLVVTRKNVLPGLWSCGHRDGYPNACERQILAIPFARRM